MSDDSIVMTGDAEIDQSFIRSSHNFIETVNNVSTGSGEAKTTVLDHNDDKNKSNSVEYIP